MTFIEHMTTVFTTSDKLYHFIGSAGAFRFLLDWLEKKGFSRLAVACTVVVLGLLYECWQLLNGQMIDPYDLLANTTGILLAWVWVWYWTR